MIFVERKVYSKLISFDRPEDCGFLVGHHSNYKKVFEMKNIYESDVKFKMGFWQKIFAIIKIMVQGYNSIAIYHVHKGKKSYLSYEDLLNAVPDTIYLIINKGKLYFYKVEKTYNRLYITDVKFEVID